MSTTRVLGILVGVLILVNVVIMGWVVFGNKHRNEKHRPRAHKSPKEIVVKRLHFSEKQVVEYEKLITSHREAVSELELRLGAKKKDLYENLANDSIVNKEQITLDLSKLMAQMEIIHYNHFKEIKGLCQPNQLEDFKALSKDLAKLFGSRPMNRPRRK